MNNSSKFRLRLRSREQTRWTMVRISITCIGLLLNLGLSLGLVFASPGLADRVIEHRLANGLTLLMVERRHAPVVSINVTFGVGGVNELTGQTGVAHLYEHMAFKGTRRLGTKNYEQERPLLARDAPHAMDAAAMQRFLMHTERLGRHALRALPARAHLRLLLDRDRRVVAVRRATRRGIARNARTAAQTCSSR